jgi:TorA maturation chaperone TorD
VAELNRTWLRVLIGYGSPEAPCWAAYYFEKDPVVMGRKTLEVRELYARYGLQIEHKYHEPDDHLGLMLQFLAHLLELQAGLSGSASDPASPEPIHDARLLLARDILPWLPQWTAAMRAALSSGFYLGLAYLIQGTLETLATALNLSLPAA